MIAISDNNDKDFNDFQKDYVTLARELIEIHKLNSEWELLRGYYRSELNARVSKERKSGESHTGKRGDRYLLFPRLREIQGCEKVGNIEDFFHQEPVIRQNLTLKGFANYLRQSKQRYQDFIKEEKLLT